jgi:hypothetical protein
MKRTISVLITTLLILGFSIPAIALANSSQTIPTFMIIDVQVDKSVTIQTENFPVNDSFTVTMGEFGTSGIGGIVVGTTESGNGGSFKETYNIPAPFKGSERIAIRLQSPTSGYFAYNWFWNNTAEVTPGPTPTPGAGYSGFPTFSVLSVVQAKSVTIQTSNLPPDDSFTVTMGKIGTKGIDGISVGSTSSGKGGVLEETYSIPGELASMDLIAIRLQSPISGYFAYNWFYNTTTNNTPSSPPSSPASSGYMGIPTFTITTVVQDKSVTIAGINFPPGDTFDVMMGPLGTQGVNGTKIGTTSSGSGGNLSATYNIPPSLVGAKSIAIRLQSPTSGYFAYNWFFNSDTTP